MMVAHLLPRQRGNVAVDNYRFVNALLWMCRTGLRGGTCRSASGSTLVEIHPGPGNEHDAAHERAAHGSARRVDALILPVTAVAGRLASGQVSRRDGDSFATVNVKLGASDGTSIIILDGLEEGDMVSATAPNLTLGAQS